jgi:hypothetical protein
VRVSPHGEVRQVDERHAAALSIDFAIRRITPDHVRDLHIEQMRRVERLTGGEQSLFHRLCG